MAWRPLIWDPAGQGKEVIAWGRGRGECVGPPRFLAPSQLAAEGGIGSITIGSGIGSITIHNPQSTGIGSITIGGRGGNRMGRGQRWL